MTFPGVWGDYSLMTFPAERGCWLVSYPCSSPKHHESGHRQPLIRLGTLISSHRLGRNLRIAHKNIGVEDVKLENGAPNL